MQACGLLYLRYLACINFRTAKMQQNVRIRKGFSHTFFVVLADKLMQMTKLGLFIAALSLSFSSVTAQTYNGPESIEFDPNDGKYFVGNTGTGAVLKLSPNGTLQSFA